MIAVDTNVIVRLIVGDDEEQARRALALASSETLYISSTVLEEVEWVLRSRYAYSRATIATALTALDELVQPSYEHPDDMHWAIERYSAGGEFADYLHIASARAIGRFATFEKKLRRRAGPAAPAAIETLN